MKVLIFGPSGSGKTYVAKAWKRKGIQAFEDSDIEGLACWYNKDGKKISPPENAQKALEGRYSFLWSKSVLRRFLALHPNVFLLGGSGNIFDTFELFDRVYFLKIEPQIQKERILHSYRETPLMDFDEKGIVIWGNWLEEEAVKRKIPFIDATRTPDEIYDLINALETS